MQRSSFQVGRIRTAIVKFPPPPDGLSPSIRSAKQAIKPSSNPGISLKLGFPFSDKRESCSAVLLLKLSAAHP